MHSERAKRVFPFQTLEYMLYAKTYDPVPKSNGPTLPILFLTKAANMYIYL